VDPFMALWILLIGLLIGFLGGVVLVYRRGVQPWKDQAQHIAHSKQSLSTSYGQITEQFAPFMEQYPFNWKQFRFIGSPIDGIQFNDDSIYFVEIKMATSSLSQWQRHIKNLIEKKKVYWYTFQVANGR
jgi:predicted Holliday junction resolvase-like endonuclease